MHVVATAGHVDHGKSSLVRALTGMEPDRWAEERRRGMTLDLGFAWTGLPSGRTVAFVDVPGHERFVATMLAGAGPVPAVLLVVAADEGWMPQSGEHLDALHALGVRHGLLAVTRADLMDPALAVEEARSYLAGTSLADIDSACVSSVTGQGIPELRTALDRLVAGLPEPCPDGPVRLWVDRAFTIRGAGTVVTATLAAGTLRVGDDLVLGTGQRAHVRGLQALGAACGQVTAVARVAVNLRGVGLSEVRRGVALLTPDRWLTTDVVDVRTHGCRSDSLPGELTVHVGTAATSAVVRPLGPDTARLTLRGGLPLRIGDRTVLRDPGARRVLAGATVLDVRPPRLRRRGSAASRASTLSTMDGRADGASELRRRGLVRAAELAAMGARPPHAPVVGDWLVDPDRWAALRAELAEVVSAYNLTHPLDPGMPPETARRALGLPELRMVTALVSDPLRMCAGRIQVGEHSPDLPPAVRAAVAQVRQALERAPFAAPETARLQRLALDRKALAAAVRAGDLLRVADGVYLLPDAAERAARVLGGLPQPFTVSAAREALDSSRRVVVPLLELLAARGLTDRLPDGRHAVRGLTGP